jgi:hypothetical protein
MASIYSIEIDGWGEVGPAIGITNAEGFADGTFTLTTGGTPPGTDEIGAMVWVEDCDAVIADGYYTLTARTATTFTMQAAVADVTVTSSAVTGLARIEDHYKISDGLPSWVTGANAQARWYRDLIGVSESAGQRIPSWGGVATVDGFEATFARISGTAAVAASTYRYSAAGPVVLSSPLGAIATTVVTQSAVPFSGESASSPTGPAQPPWFGTEAIDVRGTITDTDPVDGVTTYTMTHDGSATFVTRGVLRTLSRAHAQGVAVFGGMPTPVGQVARAYVYDYGHASHVDRSQVARGIVEGVDPSVANSTAQRISIASYLISGMIKTESPARSYTADYSTEAFFGTSPTVVYTRNGSNWSYLLAGGIAALAVTPGGVATTVDDEGNEEWPYTITTLVDEVSDYPIVRTADSVEDWWRAVQDITGRIGYTGFEEVTDGVTTAAAFIRIYRGSRFVIVGGTWPMAHVYSPVTWARDDNSDPWEGGGDGRTIQINPVDAILSILTSTGTGNNGSHDLGPAEFGFGIDLAEIDTASFTTVGNTLEDEGINAAGIALLTTEDESLRKRLDVLLKTYCLSIVTTTTGQTRIVDMLNLDYDASLTLDEGDLVNGAATMTIGTGDAISKVTLKYDRPYIRPDFPQAKITQIHQATTGGILESLGRVFGQSISVEPWFAASFDTDARNALAKRWSAMIRQTNGVVGRITANVDPGYAGQIGDTVAVSLPAFPNAQDSGAMSGALCRIVDRKHVSRPIGQNPHDELTLLAYGVTAADKPRQWAPSGVVASVTSKLVFDLETSAYHGRDYTSDAVSFADGVAVDIYDANWSLRSTVSPGTVSSTAGDTVTLSVAAAGGGGDVTPSVGDKITLAAESNQSASEAAKWGWLSTSTPGYLWR